MKQLTKLLLTLGLTAAVATAEAQKTDSAPLLIGQSAGLTGGQAQYSADAKLGIEAGFAALNRAGGIHGRPLKLLTEDDQGKKDHVLANTRKLVENHNVLALMGYTSGAGVEVSLGYIGAAGVPMLSPLTGNMGIRASFHRMLFHTRAGYDDEMKRTVKHLALTGVKRFAIAYLDDVGPANPKAMHDALQAHALQAVAAVPLDRNATDFGPQIDSLMQAQPQAVLFVSNGTPIVKIIQGMRAKGYGGQFATSSFSGLKVIEDLKELSAGLIMSQVLPSPGRKDLVLIKDYLRDLHELDPAAKPGYTSLEGYVAARVLGEGLRRAGKAPTRAKLVTALEDIRKLNLGGYEISFSSQSHDGSRFVDTGAVSNTGALRF